MPLLFGNRKRRREPSPSLIQAHIVLKPLPVIVTIRKRKLYSDPDLPIFLDPDLFAFMQMVPDTFLSFRHSLISFQRLRSSEILSISLFCAHGNSS